MGELFLSERSIAFPPLMEARRNPPTPPFRLVLAWAGEIFCGRLKLYLGDLKH